GGARTEELTLPGFRHDLCSAIHPLAVASPFFRSLPLDHYGLEWIHPTVPLAHPLDGDRAAVLQRSLDATADALAADGPAYRRLFGPLVEAGEDLFDEVLGPIRVPRHPVDLARFGVLALRSAQGLATDRFVGESARALFAGGGAHSFLPLDRPVTAAFALAMLSLGHLVGWPLPRGGSQSISDALAAYLRDLGGTIECGLPVTDIEALPRARAYVFDVTPRQLDAIAGSRLPSRYRRRLHRYRYGPGVFKLDWALSEPVPWTAEACRGAGTVHVGGTLQEIAAGEAAVWRG